MVFPLLSTFSGVPANLQSKTVVVAPPGEQSRLPTALPKNFQRLVPQSETQMQFVANKKADLFDAMAGNDYSGVKEMIQQFWPLFDDAYIEYVQNWLSKTPVGLASLEVSPIADIATKSVDEMDRILGTLDFRNETTGIRPSVTFNVINPPRMFAAGGETSSPANSQQTPAEPAEGGGRVPAAPPPLTQLHLPSDFDFLPIRERQAILRDQGVMDNEILRDPRTFNLNGWTLRKAKDTTPTDDFAWSELYSAHPDQPFNRDLKKSRDPHMSGFPKPNKNPMDLWTKVNGELDLGLVEKPVNGIALHQVGVLSYSLRERSGLEFFHCLKDELGPAFLEKSCQIIGVGSRV